jgi:hypothetical protein
MAYFDMPVAGAERDRMLASLRSALRAWIGRKDPVLGVTITEEHIQLATQEGTRDYARFNALDLALLAIHAKAGVLADQVFPQRATSGALTVHADQRDLPRLPAVGATIYAEAKADVGALFVGSTTIPDNAAAFATINGMTFQLLYDVTTPANGTAGSDAAAPMILVGVSVGDATNLPAGSKLTWAGNVPLSAAREFTTTIDGKGGTEIETEQAWGRRMADDDAHPSESGNNAHVRRWARQSSVAVEDAFGYSEAKYAGTDVWCITQKRGRQSESAPRGPLARVPSAGTLTTARAYLVPPGSPVSPERGCRFVVAPQTTYTDASIALALPRGRGLGWKDSRPWPLWDGSPATITALTSQMLFTITNSSDLPSSTSSIMVWHRSISRWEELRVTSIVDGGGGTWDVTLETAPARTIAVGDYISPATRSPTLLAQAVERYFDSLGPGEVIDTETDTRAPRAARFPDPVEVFPYRAGSAILTTIQNVLNGSTTSGELLDISSTEPVLPTDPTQGPYLLVCGHVAVYPSEDL